MPALPSALVFLAFTAAYLAIRGMYIRRGRGTQKVDKGGLRDRLLVVLVGCGQVALPLLFVATPWLRAADHAQPLPAAILGGIAMALGLWLFWRAHANLGESWSVTLELNADHRLVTRGVYRRVRHPMYLSFVVMGVGQALLLANWIAGLAGLAVVSMLVLVRVPKEEAMMIEQFGDDYRDYMRRTGGVLPLRF